MVVYNYYHLTDIDAIRRSILYRTRKGVVQYWNGTFWIRATQKTVRQLRSCMKREGLQCNKLCKGSVVASFGKEAIKPGNDIQSIIRNARRRHHIHKYCVVANITCKKEYEIEATSKKEAQILVQKRIDRGEPGDEYDIEVDSIVVK